jgi:hypothetical protein
VYRKSALLVLASLFCISILVDADVTPHASAALPCDGCTTGAFARANGQPDAIVADLSGPRYLSEFMASDTGEMWGEISAPTLMASSDEEVVCLTEDCKEPGDGPDELANALAREATAKKPTAGEAQQSTNGALLVATNWPSFWSAAPMPIGCVGLTALACSGAADGHTASGNQPSAGPSTPPVFSMAGGTLPISPTVNAATTTPTATAAATEDDSVTTPEPGTMLMLVAGLAGLMLLDTVRRKAL